MSLQVVGAGLGRTGTTSLKAALEHLLGGPCYHMVEVFGLPEHVPLWRRAAGGEMPDWDDLYASYRAAVDWPTAAFWRELSDHYPDAIVLLSTRDPDSWWRSASNTIFHVTALEPEPGSQLAAQREMILALFGETFTPDWRDEDAAKAAFLAHNDEVRHTIAPERLVEWQPGDGWAPLCAALGVPEPEIPYPHVNTTEEFRQMTGLDQPA